VTDPEVLKQEEIDALLGGVDSGEISTADHSGPTGTPRRYDFKSEIPLAAGVAASDEGQATVYAEGVPIFTGGFGGSRGQEAVKVERGARR
jgi:flagellar motor switch protein FliM